MIKKIDNVNLDYTYYPGVDLYSDGDIEDEILEYIKKGEEEKLLRHSGKYPILYHLSDMRRNLLEWYPFDENSTVLEIGSGCGAITEILSEKCKSVDCIELSEKRSLINAYRNRTRDNITIHLGNFQDILIQKKYDYITLIGVWEYSGAYISSETPYIDMLKIVKEYLKKDGKIIVAIENKMGLKYWNGAPEDHTSRLYSGLNDYIGETNVRTFSRPEIEEILNNLGLNNYEFYYPLPDYKIPFCIYSDQYQPSPGEIRFFKKDYNSSRLYNFNASVINDQICSDKLFSYFSNSFLFICSQNKIPKNEFQFEIYNRNRKREYQISTSIIETTSGQFVIKRPLTPEAHSHIAKMKKNEDLWRGILPNLEVVQGKIDQGSYISPYISGEILDISLYRFRNNIKQFMKFVKHIVSVYLTPADDLLSPFVKSAEFIKIFGDLDISAENSLSITNIDLLFQNLKLYNNKMYNFDFEWVFDFPIPYAYVIWRTLNLLYNRYFSYLRYQISKNDFMNEIGIDITKIDIYQKMESHFAHYVFGTCSDGNYLDAYEKNVVCTASRIS